jgi:hypothetical protein
MNNPKNLIPGNTYRLYFKNGRSSVADFTMLLEDNRYRFVVCDSAILIAYDWDFHV